MHRPHAARARYDALEMQPPPTPPPGHTHHGAPGRKRRGTPAPAADEDEFAEAIATPKPHTNKHSFTDSLDLEEEKPEANDDMPADDLTVVDEATAEAEIAAVPDKFQPLVDYD